MTQKLQKVSRELNPEGAAQDRIINLLEMLVAIELSKLNIPQEAIAKRLGIATAKVNATLKGSRILGGA